MIRVRHVRSFPHRKTGAFHSKIQETILYCKIFKFLKERIFRECQRTFDKGQTRGQD